MYQPKPPRPPQEVLPTMYDLPSEEIGESGLPDEFHRLQGDLLSQTCFPVNQPLEEVFVASDLNLYYDSQHTLWYKRPDWFVVTGVPRYEQQGELRLSYVTWQEGRNPLFVVELLSPGTEAEDLGQTSQQVDQPPTKWEVYERILRIPYYVVYDRYENRLQAFRLEGTSYQPLLLPERKLWLEELGLGLGLWQGSFAGTTGLWLRWYDPQRGWIATPAERSQQEHQRAEQEYQRAEQAESALGKAINQMLATGLSLEQVAEALNLSVAKVQQYSS
ncbi:MAG: Uma2 family endonuclease [Spirulinaceae cyanobacterium]